MAKNFRDSTIPMVCDIPMTKKLLQILFLLSPSFLLSQPAAFADSTPKAKTTTQAQIAVLVNKEVITEADIAERMRLALLSLGLKESPEIIKKLRPQVVNSLIEEMIQLQATKARKIELNEKALEQEYEKIAQNQGQSAVEFTSFLKNHGVSKKAFLKRLRAQMAWALYIQHMHGDMRIDERDITKALKDLQRTANQTRYHVAEIFMPVSSSTQEGVVRASMARLHDQIKAGQANFQVLAQQFSESPSASKGGDLGWTPETQFGLSLRENLKKMEIDGVSDVIRTPQGFYLLKLLDRKEAGEAESSTLLHFRQAELALPPEDDPAKLQEMAMFVDNVGNTAQTCDQFHEQIVSVGGTTVLSADVPLHKIADPVRQMMRKAEVGKMMTPIRMPTTVVLAMVCSKKTVKHEPPTKEEIALSLKNKKLSQYAANYLNKLHSMAYIVHKGQETKETTKTAVKEQKKEKKGK